MGINNKRLKKLAQQSSASNRLIVLIASYPGQGREQPMLEAGLDGINKDDRCIVCIDFADAGVL